MAKHSKKQKIDKNYLDIVFIPNPERKWSERGRYDCDRYGK